MRLWLRFLLLGTFAVMLMGVVPRPAHAQYWRRPYGHNPYYSFFWHNYWYNYGNPGWGYYPYSWYAGYWPGSSYSVPYYVAVPDPYPVAAPPRAPAAKAPEKAQKPAPPEKEPKVLPPEPKPPLSPEEKIKQNEQDAARQLRLTKTLLEAADEEQRMGKEEDAKRLRQIAQRHFREIAQKYASTPAGKEAQQLLGNEERP